MSLLRCVGLNKASSAWRRGASALCGRGFATEKQLKLKIASTENLQKITASMKMVSAAKLKGDQERLAVAKPFNVWTTRLLAPPVPLEDLSTDDWPEKNLIVPVTSDRGLCGGINGQITRGCRNMCAELKDQGKEFKLVVIGEKGRMQLRRALGNHILHAHSNALYPIPFTTVTALAQELLNENPRENWDAVHLVFNVYINAIRYEPSVLTLAPVRGEGYDEPMISFSFEPDNKRETLQNLYEWLLACSLNYAAVQNATSEQSSRMAAMENASKNAGELIDQYTLDYNKARQARITGELIEIISGAAVIESA